METEEAVGQLRLVPLTSNDLSKVITDEYGQQWLPRTELPAVLNKSVVADVDFGEVIATKTFQYVLLNVGNIDVFDIQINSTDLKIFPETIGLIATSAQGAELSALPILNIIKEHVIPIDGVGSLLDMSVGDFTDTLSISYNYELSGDTVKVDDKYDVAGTKMGAVINVITSGKNIETNTLRIILYSVGGYSHQFIGITLTSSMMDTIIISNEGNASIPIKIESATHTDTVIDSILLPYSSIDLSGMLRGQGFIIPDSTGKYNMGELLIIGADNNQPYVIKFLNRTWTEGVVAMTIDEVP